jgi:2-Cys peroxiredoxin 5
MLAAAPRVLARTFAKMAAAPIAVGAKVPKVNVFESTPGESGRPAGEGGTPQGATHAPGFAGIAEAWRAAAAAVDCRVGWTMRSVDCRCGRRAGAWAGPREEAGRCAGGKNAFRRVAPPTPPPRFLIPPPSTQTPHHHPAHPTGAGGAVDFSQLCAGKKVVVFGVPGAFTPGCSKTHLPGYVSAAGAIKAKGVAEIVCLSVNDPFVMAAWGSAQGADGKVRMLADTNGELTAALGLGIDLSKALGSVRTKRFSAVIDDGVVTALNVEPDGTGLTCSLADPILKSL